MNCHNCNVIKSICRLNFEQVKKGWDEKHDNPNDIFKYKLNVQKDKVLPGKLRFYVQVNVFDVDSKPVSQNQLFTVERRAIIETKEPTDNFISNPKV